MSFYYDIAEADNFDRLFAGTWIAEHPTPEKNKYPQRARYRGPCG